MTSPLDDGTWKCHFLGNSIFLTTKFLGTQIINTKQRPEEKSNTQSFKSIINMISKNMLIQDKRILTQCPNLFRLLNT